MPGVGNSNCKCRKRGLPVWRSRVRWYGDAARVGAAGSVFQKFKRWIGYKGGGPIWWYGAPLSVSVVFNGGSAH